MYRTIELRCIFSVRQNKNHLVGHIFKTYDIENHENETSLKEGNAKHGNHT